MENVDSIVLTVLAIVVTSCIIYDKFYLESLKDVHDLSLSEQSSISSTRKTGETAVYRSLDVMHGLPLTVGLQVRYDVYKIRNGNLKDIWKLAMDNSKNKFSFINEGDLKSFTFQELNQIFYKISIELNKIGDDKKIAIYSELNNSKTLTVVLSAFFYTDHTIQNFTKIPQLKNDDIELICCCSKDVESFVKLGYNNFVVLDDDSTDFVSYSQLLENNGLADPSVFDYNYTKKDDFQTVLVDTINFKEIEFSQVNFVSCIASQLRSLPMEHMWDSNDKLMIETSGQISSTVNSVLMNQNFFIKLLSGLVAGVHEIVVVGTGDCNLKLTNHIKPTILAVSENTLRKVISSEVSEVLNGQSLVQSLYLKLSSNWFARGIHNKLYSHSSIPHLRIIYSEVFTDSHLSSLMINYLQTVFTSRIVTEKFKIPILGPILKTNFFDYRILENDSQNGQLVLRKLGIAANCLELKIRDTDSFEAENDEGELMCRGFNIGKLLEQRIKEDHSDDEGDEGWMPTGIIGKWGADGCFYENI